MLAGKHTRQSSGDSKSMISSPPRKASTLSQNQSSVNNRVNPHGAVGNQATGRLMNSNGVNNHLPGKLQSNLEAFFGQPFSEVAIQKNSRKAVELNALAFTQGESIHFAPGQFAPDSERGRDLIGHEFAHVVQQRNGVVKPSRVLGKGLSLNEDSWLETEADNLGKKAARGEAA